MSKLNEKSRLTHVCWTLNNPTVVEEENIKGRNEFSYIIYQEETGDEETPHLQGYLELKKVKSFKKLKKIIGIRAHLERRKERNSNEKSIHYCKKPIEGCNCKHCVNARNLPNNGLVIPINRFETGIPKKNAGRVCKTIIDAIKGGTTKKKIMDEFPEDYLKLHTGIDKMIETYQPKRTTDPKVLILYGDTGSGKTYFAMNKWPDAYVCKWPHGKNVWWWNNYNHEPVVIFDEFWNQPKYGDLLALLQGYPFTVQIGTGRSTQMNSTHLIFTTNIDPEKWYPNEPFRRSLIRRLNDYAVIYDCKKKRSKKRPGEWHYERKKRTEKMPLPHGGQFNFNSNISN